MTKYGTQAARDTDTFPDAGNGVRPDGTPVTGNAPTDASVANTPALAQGYVRHLVNRWGAAARGGLRYYILDNEPSLWHDTHRDVRPAGLTLDELLTKTIDYAAAIKAVDPGAQVVGPEEWGWLGFIYSGADQQWGAKNGWGGRMPDRVSHGGRDALPWLLKQLRVEEAASGRHLLDMVSVHYYPEGGADSADVSPSAVRQRYRSTRSLWDPDYVDESWIAQKIALIPRLRGWIETNYTPGTPIAITEYRWGPEQHISGAIAEADVLGIFGREGVAMAMRWPAPASGSMVAKAFQLYRNYDGRQSAFGDVSLGVTGHNPDDLAVFAAERTTDGALTVMLLNKAATSTAYAGTLAHASIEGTASCWQLTSAGVIAHLPDMHVRSGVLADTLPAQSATLCVLPRAVMQP